jgi:hypothetical protein
MEAAVSSETFMTAYQIIHGVTTQKTKTGIFIVMKTLTLTRLLAF